MNTINDNELARQQTQRWSAQLGQLAAEQSTTNPQPASFPPSRLSALLAHLQRQRRQEHTNRTLKTNEFNVGV
jgi:hypothetical protein